jgi:hypothetical protein
MLPPWDGERPAIGLLPWDGAGAPGTLLPEWAYQLSRRCTRYNFSTQWVHAGRSVVAVRVSCTGPALVITRDEDEMRAAIGLRPREPLDGR